MNDEALNNQQQKNNLPKSRIRTGALCAIGFFGVSGLHYFYIGKIWFGALYLLTGGFCMVGNIIDFVRIISGNFEGVESTCAENARDKAEFYRETHKQNMQRAITILALQMFAVMLYPVAVGIYAGFIKEIAAYIMKILELLFIIIMSFGIALAFAPDLADIIQKPVFTISAPNLYLLMAGLIFAVCFALLFSKAFKKARIILLVILTSAIPATVLLAALIPYYYSIPLLAVVFALCFALYCHPVNYYFAYKEQTQGQKM